MRMDESLEILPGRPQVRRLDEERTKVLEGPAHYSPPLGGMSPPARPTSSRPGGRESLLERGEWLGALELPPDEGQAATETQATARASRREKKARPRPSWLRRWLHALRAGEELAPGRERVISSPLVLALVAALGLLVVLGIGLRSIIISTIATQKYDRAVDVMQDGDYPTAVRRLRCIHRGLPQGPPRRQGARAPRHGERATVRFRVGRNLVHGA